MVLTVLRRFTKSRKERKKESQWLLLWLQRVENLGNQSHGVEGEHTEGGQATA